MLHLLCHISAGCSVVKGVISLVVLFLMVMTQIWCDAFEKQEDIKLVRK